MAYLSVVSVNEALRQMKHRFQTEIPTETLPLHETIGRTLAQDVIATEDLPPFRRSMVDGYAVKISDVGGASEQSPILLTLQGQIKMGQRADELVRSGHAVYVPTGGDLPDGAEAMVMIEHTERIGPDVAVLSTPRHGEHVVARGEDVASGLTALERGTVIGPQHMGLLASLGLHEVAVIKRPTVAILSTGDELVAVNEMPKAGQVRDCNHPIIQSVIENCGCKVVWHARIPDQETKLREAIKEAVVSADLVILSGGSSAGDKDLTQKVIDSFSSNIDTPCVFIHGLAIKPGKPTIVGKIDHTPVIGLPGHPAACFITLKAMVEPFIRDWTKQQGSQVRSVRCTANFQLYAASGRDVYQLVKLSQDERTGELVADILHGKSGMVSALAKANAYVVVPMSQEGVLKGDVLTAYLL